MKKSVMTKDELDYRILNRIPNSGCHHYDGIFFLTSLLAYHRQKKRERSQKLDKQVIESPKKVRSLETIEI
jgi:hypothetical protein